MTPTRQTAKDLALAAAGLITALTSVAILTAIPLNRDVPPCPAPPSAPMAIPSAPSSRAAYRFPITPADGLGTGP
jgi:hypothetical protein